MNEVQQDKLRRAIINDATIRSLEAKRMQICSMVVPNIILKDGIPTTIWYDENNNPELIGIDKAMQLRREEITSFFNR